MMLFLLQLAGENQSDTLSNVSACQESSPTGYHLQAVHHDVGEDAGP